MLHDWIGAMCSVWDA